MLFPLRCWLAGFVDGFALSGVLRDRRAVTAVEYALIAGIIVLVLITSVAAIAPHLNQTFNSVSSEL